jgi:hypothetical protein
LSAYKAAIEPLWIVEKKFEMSHLSADMALYRITQGTGRR